MDPSSEPEEWPRWIVGDMLAVENLMGYCRMVWVADWRERVKRRGVSSASGQRPVGTGVYG